MDDKKLKDAIEHCKEVVSKNEDCKECINEHYELMNWLLELQNLREFKARVMDAIYK